MDDITDLIQDLIDSGRIFDSIDSLERAVQGGEDEELEDGDLISVDMDIGDARELLVLLRRLESL